MRTDDSLDARLALARREGVHVGRGRKSVQNLDLMKGRANLHWASTSSRSFSSSAIDHLRGRRPVGDVVNIARVGN